MAVHTRGTRGATASVGGTARLLLVVQRGFLLARFARDGARRGGDADRLTPVDIVVDPLRRLLTPLSLASLLGLMLGLPLELLGPLVGAESRHGYPLPGDSARVYAVSAMLDSARSACERGPVSPPERTELLALMDANMVAVYAADTRATPGGAVVETPGLVMCRTPHGTVATNMAIVTGPLDAPTVRARTLAFYGPSGSLFSVWTREHADAGLEGELGTLGFHPIHREPGMAFLPGAGRPAPPPPRATIRPVKIGRAHV